ncbi:hypothetical protein ACFV3F_43295 [Streptomyces sp. NPDC059717]|uniref:hypothetical protein n=1 Tax=Streptomyces sp. NPDC059717 TaxID=3346922 RepID=UPI0036BCD0D4
MNEWDVPEHLLRLAAQAAKPELQPHQLREHFGAAEQVRIQEGQVWRARWNSAVVLVLILEVGVREVRAVPVTLDPPAEDESCLILDGSRSVFGIDVTVWADLMQGIPVRVLDQVLDTWDSDVLGCIRTITQGGVEDAAVGMRTGKAPDSLFEDAVAVRAELEDELAELCAAPGLVSVDDVKPAKGALAALLGDQLDLAHLTKALGKPQSQVMAMLRGKKPLEAEDIAGLAEATGLSQEKIATSVQPLPQDLVEAVEHPRWRPVMVRLARQTAGDEAQARLRAGYGAFVLAARETGGSSPDWEARLKQFLASQAQGGTQ